MPRFSWFNSSNSEPTTPVKSGAGLGTFGGVYTPSLLTILGVIMYLRFGWVVGNVGLLGTLIIVTLSTSITFLTGLSISAIATDRIVRAGGAYYMISRSLGIETGGAVGIPLYFAQAISVALYIIGFTESLTTSFPILEPFAKIIALGTTGAIAFVALVSARFAVKAQYFIMAAIALSLLSFLFGHPVDPNTHIELWGVKPENSANFWVVFAVFFPAVTGIMAGVNMSGDLRDPNRSIPIGTLASIGTSYIIYMALPVFLAMRADAKTLVESPLIMREIALWGPAILLGVWGATLSSALGSILGAPRVLQALARDGIFPRWMKFLGNGSGPDDEPRSATFVTLGVASAAVVVGDLNLIAPVLSMFFLTTYLVLNVAAGLEGFLQSPSFRPTFKVHWSLSLLGAIGCFWVMCLINLVATLVAAFIVLGIYFWLERRELESAWGDVRRGLWMELIRTGLFQIGHEADTKNWRPHILVLSGAPMRRWPLISLASEFTHNRGLMTVSSVIPSGSLDAAQKVSLEATIRDYLAKRSIQGLVRLAIAPDPFDGSERLVDVYGIGSLVPNTILLGDSQEVSHRQRYCESIAYFHQAKRNVVILHDHPELGFGRRRRIDVWWGGLQSNGGLMLILAYLLRTSSEWRGAEVNLNLVVPHETAALAATSNLKTMVKQLRIGANPQVIVANDRSFDEILHQSSVGADLVFLGMAKPGETEENFTEYYQRIQERLRGLPSTVLVLAAPDFAFEEVLTDIQK